MSSIDPAQSHPPSPVSSSQSPSIAKDSVMLVQVKLNDKGEVKSLLPKSSLGIEVKVNSSTTEAWVKSLESEVTSPLTNAKGKPLPLSRKEAKAVIHSTNAFAKQHNISLQQAYSLLCAHSTDVGASLQIHLQQKSVSPFSKKLGRSLQSLSNSVVAKAVSSFQSLKRSVRLTSPGSQADKTAKRESSSASRRSKLEKSGESKPAPIQVKEISMGFTKHIQLHLQKAPEVLKSRANLAKLDAKDRKTSTPLIPTSNTSFIQAFKEKTPNEQAKHLLHLEDVGAPEPGYFLLASSLLDFNEPPQNLLSSLLAIKDTFLGEADSASFSMGEISTDDPMVLNLKESDKFLLGEAIEQLSQRVSEENGESAQILSVRELSDKYEKIDAKYHREDGEILEQVEQLEDMSSKELLEEIQERLEKLAQQIARLQVSN